MDDFGQSRAVQVIKWPAIHRVLCDMNAGDYYANLRDRALVKRAINDTAEVLRMWLLPIIDISDLPHAYHTNGTHGAIEQWLASETRPVYTMRGEYQYPKLLRSSVAIVDDISAIPKDAVVYISMPFSATGSYDDRYDAISNPMVLDLAYVGTTGPHRLRLLPNVEQVFWSASKTFGLSAFRTGYRFCRTADSVQDNLKDAGYFNWMGVEILRRVLAIYTVTQTMDIVLNDYIELCRRNELAPSASYLLATATDQRYQRFARDQGTLRVPTGLLLDKMYGYALK